MEQLLSKFDLTKFLDSKDYLEIFAFLNNLSEESLNEIELYGETIDKIEVGRLFFFKKTKIEDCKSILDHQDWHPDGVKFLPASLKKKNRLRRAYYDYKILQDNKSVRTKGVK